MSEAEDETKRKARQKPQSRDQEPSAASGIRATARKVEALGAEGKSAPEIRRELGISPSAWRSWVKKHPEFAEAVEQAADLAEAWWIDVGRKGMMLGHQLLRADLHLPHEEHLPRPLPRPAGPPDHRRQRRPDRAGASRA